LNTLPQSRQSQKITQSHRIGFLLFPGIGFEAILKVQRVRVPKFAESPVSRRSPDAEFFRNVVYDEDENEEIESIDRPAR
jgi:hypothetical protein